MAPVMAQAVKLLAAVAAAVAPGATAAGMVRLQEAVVPDGWQRGARAPGSLVLNLVIALRNWNMKKLDEEVFAVSLPRSPRYGQHLRPEEVADLTSAAPEAQLIVTSWLREAGLAARPSRWADRLEVRASVDQVEELFATHVSWLERVGSPMVLQATDLLAPPEVVAAVAAVFGIHGVPLRRPPAPSSGVLPTRVTPDLLRQVHEVSGVQVGRIRRNSRAVVEFHDQHISRADVDAFFEQFVPGAPASDRNFSCHPGPCDGQTSRWASTQANVDIEYLMGPAPGIKTEAWSFSSMSWCMDLKNWTTNVLDLDDPPLVFSVGYGIQGDLSHDTIQGCSPEMVRNIEEDFVKIAARGVTLIFSSGDDGSGGAFRAKQQLWPAWPGSAPYATSVGATQFERGSRQQRAAGSFGSGGGFSRRHPRPSWQLWAVEAYLSKPLARLPAEEDFSRHGRATPDLAAMGLGYEAVAGGRTVAVAGTAAAASFFASLVSLLNEYRLQNGQSPLGFLNPLIYEMGMSGKGFADITAGDNRRNRNGRPLLEGYSCTRGWDAVTGWGAPRFQDMLEYVKDLPSGRRHEELVI